LKETHLAPWLLARVLTAGLSLLKNLFDLGIGSPVKIATDDFYQPNRKNIGHGCEGSASV
jgi:hypothetical protein